MSDKDFSHIAAALNKIGSVTNKKIKANTKSDRIRLQKLVYLLKFLNYPATQNISFNLYLNGPYSRDLARWYYKSINTILDFSNVPTATDIPDATLEFIKEADSNGTVFLEALTTFLDIKKAYKNKEEAIKVAKSLKPTITNDYWSKVLKFIDKAEHHTIITQSI